jgi:putative lipoprotein
MHIRYFFVIFLFSCSMSVFAAIQSVTGSVTYLQRIALPDNAEVVVELQLQDVSNPAAPAMVVTSQHISNPGQVPVKFALFFDDKTIKSDRHYVVDAKIKLNDNVLFYTDKPYPVLTLENPNHAELVLAMSNDKALAALLPTTQVRLEETYWKLVQLGADTIASSKNTKRHPFMRLETKSSRVNGTGGCNFIMGSYELDKSTLVFDKNFITTLMSCPSGMDTDIKFTNALKLVATYKIDEDHLYLYDEKGQELAEFKAER